jgi:hypothetical protein
VVITLPHVIRVSCSAETAVMHENLQRVGEFIARGADIIFPDSVGRLALLCSKLIFDLL